MTPLQTQAQTTVTGEAETQDARIHVRRSLPEPEVDIAAVRSAFLDGYRVFVAWAEPAGLKPGVVRR